MSVRRITAGVLTILFLTSPFAGLAGASTGPGYDGDVIINGAFRDTTEVGSPQKLYCDPYAAADPRPAAPEQAPGEASAATDAYNATKDGCAHANVFVAYDWTTAAIYKADVSPFAGGMRVQNGAFLQQHFNGTDAPDRTMKLYAVEVTARANTGTSAGFRVEIRGNTDADSAVESHSKPVSVSSSSTKVLVTASELVTPTGAFPLRSVRLWANAGADLVIERVSVYATNGIEARNIHVAPTGDDVATAAQGALLLGPGADGVYSFHVGMATDTGEFLPTKRAALCLYTAEQAVEDRGFPANTGPGGLCQGAFAKHVWDGADTPGIAMTTLADGFRFDVASTLVPPASDVPAFVVYAHVEGHKSYDDVTTSFTEEFRAGYLHVGRLAADQAGAGVSREYYGGTPVLVDEDANGVPDGAQTDNTDGYAVIVTPRRSVAAAPFEPVTLLTPDHTNAYAFEVEAYDYTGAAVTNLSLVPANLYLSLFDASSAGPSAFWRDEGAVVWSTQLDPTSVSVKNPTTLVVRVPANAVQGKLVGVFAYYGVDGASWDNALGANGAASDFYSALQTGAKTLPVADALRGHGTPVLLAANGAQNTDTRHGGDVAVNGAFRDARALGHPLKLYAPTTQFAAFDWSSDNASNATLVADGIELRGNSFLQQHMAGESAPDRMMPFYGISVTGSAASASSLRVEVRYNADEDSAAESGMVRVAFGPTESTRFVSAAELGIPAGATIPMRSVRLWHEGSAPIVIERVQVHAKNGIMPHNNFVDVTGDDTLAPVGDAVLHQPGADGKYSWTVRTVDDYGYAMLIEDAVLCVYAYEGYPVQDQFSNPGGACPSAILTSAQSATFKTRTPEGVRFDVPTSALTPKGAFTGGFVVWASVEIDGPSGGAYATETFRAGWFNAAQAPVVDAHAGGAAAEWGALPTPVLFDRNGDGTADFVQADEMDGYSVIITPRLSTATPAATVVTTDTEGNYLFEVQVYDYEGATGAPMDLSGGLALAFFDGTGLVNGGAFDAEPFWKSTGGDATLLPDGKTFLVRVPGGAVPKNTPVGAWAFYNVGEPDRYNVASAPYGGYSQSATDFYSVLRNNVKGVVIADGMRSAGTPIVFDQASITRDATLVIRMDATADELTPLDGTVVVSPGDDGSVTFEYALYYPDGARVVGGDDHALAIYDAAGAMSDELQPGKNGMQHAEFVGKGSDADGDGWFRIDVPVSAFGEAKGAVGAWAYVNHRHSTGFVLSRSSWYNVAKEDVAGLSTSAANASLYEPTPIVILDEQLGIPEALAATLAATPSSLFSIQNPLVNPGFEVDLLVEGRNARDDATGGTMTSPPWFFRLDDQASTTTDPVSTHEVVPGAGRLGDRALKVVYDAVDRPHGLMLGQLLGTEQGSAALVWKDASAVTLDVKTTNARAVSLAASIRYLATDGSVGFATETKTIAHTSGWQSVTFATPVPAGAQLLGVYLSPKGSSGNTFYVDNVAVKGAHTALGDTRTDLSDGYAMIITPLDVANGQQLRVQGATGQFYLYEVEVADYTGQTPAVLDLAGRGRTFGYMTSALDKDVGETLTLRGDTTAFVAAVPVEEVPDRAAAPWAWVRAGAAYNPFGSPQVMQPASGYYSPVKNALAGAPVADQLDYAGTPVVFGAGLSRTMVFPQTIRLVGAPGGYGVEVEADSPFVETTTVTLTRGATTQTFTVTLQGADGDIVPGAFIAEADLAATTIATEDTLFTRGKVLVPGEPTADFEFCRPVPDSCIDVGVLSNEALTFRSTSVAPGEPITTYVWSFPGQAPVTESDGTETHTFTRPGSKVVGLTVFTASGKSATVERTILVNNRAPDITNVLVSPSGTIAVTDPVSLRAIAADPDGGSLLFTWTVEGYTVPGLTSSSIRLTESILENATGERALQRRTYSVAVSVSDGQGGVDSAVKTFTVTDRPADVAAPVVTVVGAPSATYAIEGDLLAFAVDVTDADGDVASAVALELLDGATVVETLVLATNATGAWVGQLDTTTLGAGLYQARAVATVGAASVTSPSTDVDLRADLAPLLANLTGPELLQVFESGKYAVEAVDPDGRGIASWTWTLDGAPVATGSPAELTFTEVGIFRLDVTVRDATGASATMRMNVSVDDVLVVELTVEEEAETANGTYVVLARVLRWDGTPVEGAYVTFEDTLGPMPTPYQTAAFYTDADGEARYEVEADLGFTFVGLGHRIKATATADSHPDAPLADSETASAELVVGVAHGPLAGLPLP